MVSTVDPGTAAAIAEGDVDGEQLGDDPADGGGDPAGDPADAHPPADDQGGGWLDALMQTEPSTPLEAVESPWRPDVGGAARVYRGVQKMTGMDGTPAIMDVLIGFAEIVVDGDLGDDLGGDQADDRAGDQGNAPVVVDE